MSDQKKIKLLLALSIVMSFFLFGFVAINYSDYHQQLKVSEMGFGCGTANVTIDYMPEELANPVEESGRLLFKANCKSCHRLRQKFVGPALVGIFVRRDSVWIRKMILNANALLKSGDKEAKQFYNEYGQLDHTPFKFTQRELDDLLIYLQAEENMSID